MRLFIFALLFPATLYCETLPEGLKWETADNEPTWADPNALKGGTFHTALSSFPLTLRDVGPDSNTGMRDEVSACLMSLTNTHPNNMNQILPELAVAWAYGNDNKTVYYKLDPRATWSDGVPLVADDFAFEIEFMRSKEIVAPWYNTYYTDYFDKVIVYDDHTIAVVGKVEVPHDEIMFRYGMSPRPRRHYKLDANFVKDYNWKLPICLGPYVFDKVEKGKRVTLKRVKNWWGENLRYNKGRYNVDTIEFQIIRDVSVMWMNFLKGNLDSMGLTLPLYWHDKAQTEEFKKGYIHKFWFYNDLPRDNFEMALNTAYPPFTDLNTRIGFHHAMNVQKVIEVVSRGEYQRSDTSVEGYEDFDHPTLKAREFSLEKADEYLKKGGWVERGSDGIRVKDGQRLSARITISAETHMDRVTLLKEEAKKAGIELEIQLLDGMADFKTKKAKKHQIGYDLWGAQFRPDFWSLYHSSGLKDPDSNNFTNIADPELDDLLLKFRQAHTHEDRVLLCHKVLEKIHALAITIPLTHIPFFRTGYWNYWKLPEIKATKTSNTSLFELWGYSGSLFWLDPKAKEETLAKKKKGESMTPYEGKDERYRKKI